MLDVKSAVHMHEDDLELYIRGQLEPERLSCVENHLGNCKICRQQLSNCLGSRLTLQLILEQRKDTAQKRSEPRFSTEGEGTLQELHPLSLDRHKVRVVNVSKNGLGILSPKALLPGTIVQLRMNDIIELGNVRYCAATEAAGFRIGLKLNSDG